MKDKRPTLAQLQSSFRASMPHDQDPSKMPAWMHEKPRAPRKVGVKNKTVEHDTQADVVRWLHKLCPSVVVSASLNGELYGLSRHVPKGVFFGFMNKLKNRGLLAGYADLVLHFNCSGYQKT